MGYQTVFKRYELKYIISKDQKERILGVMSPYMVPDKYGRSTVRNIYYDTDDHILARHSIAKPDFKEKLRIRSYSLATPDSTVFVELKRKYDHIVYKRRVVMPEHVAMAWTQAAALGNPGKTISPQMKDEIDYFISYYGHLKPAAFLSYDRQAFRMRAKDSADSDFRVTFDENILFRDHDLSLTSEPYGERILEDGKVLMELKCSGGIPLWMVKTLSEEHIYKTSFSKYGTAYMNFIYPEERHKVAASEAGRVAAASARTAAAASNPQHTAKGRFAAAAAQRKKLPRAAGAFRSQVYTYR